MHQEGFSRWQSCMYTDSTEYDDKLKLLVYTHNKQSDLLIRISMAIIKATAKETSQILVKGLTMQISSFLLLGLLKFSCLKILGSQPSRLQSNKEFSFDRGCSCMTLSPCLQYVQPKALQCKRTLMVHCNLVSVAKRSK